MEIGLTLGDGEPICLKLETDEKYLILDGTHDEYPSEWRIISNSFENFLNQLIDGRGKKFWLPW